MLISFGFSGFIGWGPGNHLLGLRGGLGTFYISNLLHCVNITCVDVLWCYSSKMCLQELTLRCVLFVLLSYMWCHWQALPETGYQLFQKYGEQIQKWGWIINNSSISSQSFKKYVFDYHPNLFFFTIHAHMFLLLFILVFPFPFCT